MSEYRQPLMDKFRSFLIRMQKDGPDHLAEDRYFWAKLFTAKNKNEFMRELEINGYRLACDKQHGLAAVHVAKPIYSLERIAQSGSLGRMKLGDLSDLPTTAEAKATFNQHMIKVLPLHMKHQSDKYREQQSLLLKDIVEQRKLEKTGDPSARMQRDSLIQWASWQRRDYTLQKARLKDDIYSYKVDLRLETMQRERAKGINNSQGNGIGM